MLNKKGESLVEVIVSLLLFVVLLGAVVTMVQTSLAIVNRTQERNKELSDSVYNIESNSKLTDVEELDFTFEITGEVNKEIDIPVTVKQSGGLRVYAPK